MVELTVVVMIMGLLALIALPLFSGSRDKANNSNAKLALRSFLDQVAVPYYKQNQDFTSFDGKDAQGNSSEPAYTPLSSGTDSTSPGRITISMQGNFATPPAGNAVALSNKSSGGAYYCLEYNGSTGSVTYGKAGTQAGAVSNCTNSSWP